jgi:lipopolysaccharide export system ATP-binding protein
MEGQAGRLCIGRLVAESLCYSAGRNQILSDVTVEVANDEIVGLLGRDGAGKTSLFQLLAGLLAPDSGRILLNGTDVTARTEEERARLGLCYLPEEPSIFRDLTAEENVQLALDVLEPNVRARPSRLEQLLGSFQLLHVRNQPATSLSGGERRRCEVARSMAAHPAILMLDEPFRGLDPMSVREVARSVAALGERQVGVLISDYDLHDLIGLIDRAYVLHEGRIIFSGSSQELLADEAVRHLYLGESFTL